VTFDLRNPSSPRLASSSKDGTVGVWSTLARRTEYMLRGHLAIVNVVKWGSAGGRSITQLDGTWKVYFNNTTGSVLHRLQKSIINGMQQ
jgi:WD40 repeat protein